MVKPLGNGSRRKVPLGGDAGIDPAARPAAGRGAGSALPSSFVLGRKQRDALKAVAAAGELPNPYSRGFFHFLIEALKQLGADRAHRLSAVTAAFRRLANAPRTYRKGATYWKRWKRKDSALPWQQRFRQNVEVLQRVSRPGVRNRSPYGEKLKRVGTELLGTRGVVIDILRGPGGTMAVRLNTDSPLPINEFRTRREDSRKVRVARFRRAQEQAQNGRCAICPRRGRLCVDHCHRQNHLRGLLCRRCNLGLGHFGDSAERLLRAALYLMDTAPSPAVAAPTATRPRPTKSGVNR